MGKQHRTIRTAPQQILGYRDNGKPIRTIAGGSTPPETTTPPSPTDIRIPVVTTPPPAPAQQTQTFDPAAERARIQQELQQQFDQRLEQERAAFDQRLAPIEQERLEQERQRQEAERLRQEAEQRAQQEQETAAERMARLERENAERISGFEQELARRDAIIAQEQRANQLADYTRLRVEEAGDDLYPDLRVNVYGSSEAEIDAALSRQLEISQSILEAAQARSAGMYLQQQQQAQLAPGVTPTAPALGPLEGNGAGQPTNFSPADIERMSPAEYAQHRTQLLAWTSQARQRQ